MRAGKGGGQGGEGRRKRDGWAGLRLALAVLACLICEVSGWIALSKDGFKVTKALSLNNGSNIEGDILINGVIHSSNYTWLGPPVQDIDLCDSTRDGSLRWNALTGDFEGCDAESKEWHAVRFCSRDCGFSHLPLQQIRNSSHGGPFNCSSARLYANNSFMGTKDGSFCEDSLLAFDGWAGQQAFADSRQWRLGLPDGATEHYACGVRTMNVRNKVVVPLYEDMMRPGLISRLAVYGNVYEEAPSEIVWTRDVKGNPTTETFCAEQILLQTVPIVTPWTDARLDPSPQNSPLPAGVPVPDTRCSHYDFDSPAFDFLRIFYNVSGWQSLLPPVLHSPLRRNDTLRNETWSLYQQRLKDPNTTNATRGTFVDGWPSILSKAGLGECSGVRHVNPMWYSFSRDNHTINASGIFKSGYMNSYTVGNDTVAASCTVRIYAPMGFRLRLSFLDIDIDPAEVLTVFEPVNASGGWTERNISSNSSSGVQGNGDLPLVISNNFGSFLEIRFNSTSKFPRNSTGYILSYDYMGRGGLLLESKESTTLLQYALVILEMQGVNMKRLGWSRWPGFNDTKPPGYVGLGDVTEAEMCFICCTLGSDYEVAGAYIRLQYQQSHLENAPIGPSWVPRPLKEDVGAFGAVSLNFLTTVDTVEIPPLVGNMGYTRDHFVRSGYISRFPPGTIKAPFGSPLGQRTPWTVAGMDDPSLPPNVNQPREELGWGLSRMMLQPGGNFTDRSSHGWGGGWGDGTLPGQGTQWRDFDGSNAQWFPSWQIAAPSNSSVDRARWRIDLDHEDVALFSFVDNDRRVVFANDLALSISCGVKVNNTCGVGCSILGTGLNMLQCLANMPETACSQPVVDDCNNECGTRGTLECDVSVRGVGIVRIHSKSSVNATANFQMTVGLEPDSVYFEKLPDRSQNFILNGTTVEGGWARPARPFPLPDDSVDNALYLSYHDPLEDVDFATVLNGKTVRLTFSKAQIDILSSKVSFDIPLPIECPGDPSMCAAYGMDPVDELTGNLKWVNVAQVPYWDSNYMSKTVDYLEFPLIVERNLKILELLFISDCLGVPDPDCDLGSQRLEFKLLRKYARSGDGLPCSQAEATSLCSLAMDDLQFMVTDLESRRTEMMQLVASRPRFNMAKIRRLGGPGGLEFASPDPSVDRTYNHNSNTMRISTDLELVGDYVRLGSSRYVYNRSECNLNEKNVPCGAEVSSSGRGRDINGIDIVDSGWIYTVTPHLDTCPQRNPSLCFAGGLCDISNCSWALDLDETTLSHIFVDGEIEKECPFSFNGGSDKWGRTRFCVQTNRIGPLTGAWEAPKVDPLNPNTNGKDRVITLPDISGRVFLSTSVHEITNLRGFRMRSSFTPYKYTKSSILTLDNGQDLDGQTFWNKKFGAPSGICGVFDDNVEIVCPPLKFHYDSVESSQDESDSSLIFTGHTILQGSSLRDVTSPLLPVQRIECSALYASSSCDQSKEGIGGLQLKSKQMYVCVNFAGQLVSNVYPT